MVSFMSLPTLNNGMANCLEIHLGVDFNVCSLERFPGNFPFGSSLLGPCNVCKKEGLQCN